MNDTAHCLCSDEAAFEAMDEMSEYAVEHAEELAALDKAARERDGVAA